MATFKYSVKINGEIIPAHTPVDETDIVGAVKETDNDVADIDANIADTKETDNGAVEETDNGAENKTDNLNNLTVAQLKALAAEKGVDISDCRLKAEFIDAISRA